MLGGGISSLLDRVWSVPWAGDAHPLSLEVQFSQRWLYALIMGNGQSGRGKKV